MSRLPLRHRNPLPPPSLKSKSKMDLNSEYGLKEEYGRYSLVLESQLHIKHIIEELDELQLEARSLPDWTRNLDTIETTCLYSHPSNELFNSTILESLAQLLEKKYLSVKHVDLYEYRELHCDLYPNPRLWSIPGSDRLKPGPQELRLFDCMLDPTYCSLWPWIYMLPTLRAVRILGENTRFLNDSKWSLCPYADATRAWITTIELRIKRVDMIRQAVTFTHYFANLQHLELDFSCTVGTEEENALTENIQAFQPTYLRQLKSLRLKLSQCCCCSHRRRFCRHPLRWKWVPRLISRFAISAENPRPILKKISFDVLYNPRYDSFETSEIWQEIARSLRRVIPQGPGSTPPGVREIYFVQDCDAETQFLAQMSETIKTWLWATHRIPRQLVYIHGRVE
ncbi:hypothetical protein QCA50_011600 [Cerrena zonata]|uniref:Uncharacterized protein n=1 Tax=Cerrena zonata TaxID=2478898 RepID=A0AAW0FYN6_9APHY